MGLGNASKELEREQIKYQRMYKELNTIVTYRESLDEKKIYIDKVKEAYPDLMANIKPFNIHKMSLQAMKTKVTTYLEEERIHDAVVRLQRFWRNKSKAMISWGILKKIFTSVRKIQRAYRSSKWLRLLG